MASSMVYTTKTMLDKWSTLIINSSSMKAEIDIEKEIIATTGEIIAKTSFGISYEKGHKVFEKLRAIQQALFKSSRFVGVPFGKFMFPKQTFEAKRLGKEVDKLLLSIINVRKESIHKYPQSDLLGLLLRANSENKDGPEKMLSTQELIDECKTFFFGGHDTTALALTWTLLLLASHPEWQIELREEIKLFVGDKDVDFASTNGLTKVCIVYLNTLCLFDCISVKNDFMNKYINCICVRKYKMCFTKMCHLLLLKYHIHRSHFSLSF